jgi:hypothetical protein
VRLGADVDAEWRAYILNSCTFLGCNFVVASQFDSEKEGYSDTGIDVGADSRTLIFVPRA